MNLINSVIVRALLGALVAASLSGFAVFGAEKGVVSMQAQQFLKAVAKGDVAGVRDMLKKDPALARAVNADGVSAVLLAAYYRRKEVLAELLASGVELNGFEAAAIGNLDRVRALLEKDAGLANSYSTDGFTALGLATFFGHKDMVELLLTKGAKVNVASRNAMKVMPLHSAAAARRLDLAAILINHGADVNARQEGDVTPLHEAAASGQMELVKLLLAHGADVDAKTRDGKTASQLAEDAGQAEAVMLLKKHGAAR
jgi:ankyrin repeat protein